VYVTTVADQLLTIVFVLIASILYLTITKTVAMNIATLVFTFIQVYYNTGRVWLCTGTISTKNSTESFTEYDFRQDESKVLVVNAILRESHLLRTSIIENSQVRITGDKEFIQLTINTQHVTHKHEQLWLSTCRVTGDYCETKVFFEFGADVPAAVDKAINTVFDSVGAIRRCLVSSKVITFGVHNTDTVVDDDTPISHVPETVTSVE